MVERLCSKRQEPFPHQAPDPANICFRVQPAERAPQEGVGRPSAAQRQRHAVMRQCSYQQIAHNGAFPIIPSDQVVPSQRVIKPLAGAWVVAQQYRDQVRCVPGTFYLPALPHLRPRPYLCLETDVHFADVMQRGEHTQPIHRPFVQRLHAGRAREPVLDSRLGQQRFHACPHISKMVFQQMHPVRHPMPIRVGLGPKQPGVPRCAGHHGLIAHDARIPSSPRRDRLPQNLRSITCAHVSADCSRPAHVQRG